MGGLVEHTVGVASLVQALTVWHPRLDADLLLAAALVHDIGHARGFTLGATFAVKALVGRPFRAPWSPGAAWLDDLRCETGADEELHAALTGAAPAEVAR